MAKVTTTDTKPAKPEKAKAAKQSKPGGIARLGQYFRDVRSEMNRVVWPQPAEVRTSSVVVVVTLLFFVGLTLLIDTVVVYLLDLLQKIG